MQASDASLASAGQGGVFIFYNIYLLQSKGIIGVVLVVLLNKKITFLNLQTKWHRKKNERICHPDSRGI